MDTVSRVHSFLEDYNRNEISIATIGSHSALQIFKGAREEGFKTVCIVTPGRDKLYKRFGLADEFIYVDHLKDLLNDDIQEKLRSLNSVIVPHGSFNAYINQAEMEEKLLVPLVGNRTLLKWETSRELQHKWLKDAGLRVPRIYDRIDDIDGLVFVKFPGARGGKGYFIVDSPDAYETKMQDMINRGLVTAEVAKKPYIQEYIVGVSIYPHYHYSGLSGKTEVIGIDKRYETSVDGIDRIPVPEQLAQKINPSFTVVGNFPMVVRESLLDNFFDLGEKIVAQSQKIAPPGAVGPFCLETICTEDLNIIAFEISARIVAGCNVNIGYSPYTYLTYDEPMYMGKRIAREIKEAAKADQLKKVVT